MVCNVSRPSEKGNKGFIIVSEEENTLVRYFQNLIFSELAKDAISDNSILQINLFKDVYLVRLFESFETGHHMLSINKMKHLETSSPLITNSMKVAVTYDDFYRNREESIIHLSVSEYKQSWLFVSSKTLDNLTNELI